jgi:hypothetical protein
MRAGILNRARRGHPFRAAFAAPRQLHVNRDDGDLRLFVLSFTAFFVCFYTFLL